MDHADILLSTIVFEPPATSPDRRRHRHRQRHRHRHHRVPPFLFSDHWATDSTTDDPSSSSDGFSSSDGGNFGLYAYRRPRRRKCHKDSHMTSNLPVGVPNTLAQRPAAVAAPRNYGYRRLHYQGGQREHRGRQRTRLAHCHFNANLAGSGTSSPRRNILVRCGRWLFGESRRCYCGLRGCGGGCHAPATGCCGHQRSRSRSPTRHREEEYWGPGTQGWVYGPQGQNANWRDTPWSSGGNKGTNVNNLAPGGVVEEVEEGGTLPAVAAVTDRTPKHYHIGSDGHSGRSSRRRGIEDYMRQQGVLGLVNRERNRDLDLDPEMVYRQTADRQWERELDRDMMELEIAKQRDQHLLALIDRERERELKRAMVDRDTTKQRHDPLLTLFYQESDGERAGKIMKDLLDQELERRRDVHPGTSGNDRSKKRLIKREGLNDESKKGVRAEMEALRKEFRNLMGSTSKSDGAVGTERTKRDVSVVSSVTSQPLRRPKPSADIQTTHGRTINDGVCEDMDEEEDEDDSVASSRMVFGNGRVETNHVFQVLLPTNEASDSS